MKTTIRSASLMAGALALVIAAAPSPALAAKKKNKNPQEQVDAPAKSLTVSIPQSELQKAQANEVAAEAPVARPFSVELLISSWTPSKFELNSYFPTSEFSSAGLPYVSFAGLTPLKSDARVGAVALKLGAGFRTLRRTGSTTAGSAMQIKDEQYLYLIPVQVGVEYTPSVTWPAQMLPYLGASLMPTAALAARSTLSGPITTGGVPVLFSTGVTAAPEWLQALNSSELSIRRTRLNVGFSLTAGKVGGGSVFGWGLGAGLQVAL